VTGQSRVKKTVLSGGILRACVSLKITNRPLLNGRENGKSAAIVAGEVKKDQGSLDSIAGAERHI